MKHTACQHTDEGEPACESCEYFGIIPKCTPSTLPSFNSFMSSVSHIDLSKASAQMIAVLMEGLPTNLSDHTMYKVAA
jgi:hypothetical protein